MKFVPFEFPSTADSKYICLLDEPGILRSRREQLGLTMQQVAQIAGLKFSQYQRLESGDRTLGGSSAKVCLAVCAALLLDPYEMVGISVKQPDTLQPQRSVESPIHHNRVGRKQIRREKAYVNYHGFSILLPYDLFPKIGSPDFFQVMWNFDKRRIIIRPATSDMNDVFDVPKVPDGNNILVLPTYNAHNPISAMNWGDTGHEVDVKVVTDSDGNHCLLLNLLESQAIEKIEGTFIGPTCTDDRD